MDRQNDPTIDGDMVLLRRIPPKADRGQWDASSGMPALVPDEASDAAAARETIVARARGPGDAGALRRGNPPRRGKPSWPRCLARRVAALGRPGCGTPPPAGPSASPCRTRARSTK